jgi:hypothetical protein
MTPEPRQLVGTPRQAMKHLMVSMAPDQCFRVSAKYKGEERYYKTQTLVENFHLAVFTICSKLPLRQYKYMRCKDSNVPALIIKRIEDSEAPNPLWFGEGHKLEPSDVTSD